MSRGTRCHRPRWAGPGTEKGRHRRVIIAGSRGITDYAAVCKAVADSDFCVAEVLSGLADGSDTPRVAEGRAGRPGGPRPAGAGTPTAVPRVDRRARHGAAVDAEAPAGDGLPGVPPRLRGEGVLSDLRLPQGRRAAVRR